MKKDRAGIIVILVAGWVAVHALGCAPSSQSKDELVMAIEVEPQTLDPRFAVDAYSAKVSDLVFSGLVDFDDHYEVRPKLAASYAIEQETHYTFELKPGLKFSDGSPLTAGAVVATIESVLHPDSRSPLKSGLAVIREIRAVGSKTIDIRLARPHAPFLSLMTLGIVKPSAPPRIGWDPAGLIGSGPYRLVARDAGRSLRLEANPYYEGEAPLAPALRLKVIPDETTRVLEMLHGRVDLVFNGIPPLLLDTLQAKGRQVIAGRGGNFSYLIMNLGHPALADIRVRRALAEAIPVEALIQYRLAGRGRRGTGILPPEHWAFEPRVETQPFQPEAAAALLDEAGFPDPDGPGPRPRLALTYKTSNRKDRMMTAKLVARALNQIGVEVRVRPLEWGTFFADIRSGRFDLASLTWVGVIDPDIYHEVFHSGEVPPVGNNRGGYHSERVDRLVLAGRTAATIAARARIYREVQRIIAHDLPVIGLWYEDNVAVAQKNIRGIRLDPRASLDFLTRVRKETW